jgi:hypothetical protein
MAGRKGRSGPIAADLQTWCAEVIRQHALPKMRTCITSRTPDRAAFRWCVEQLAKMGNLYAPVQHEHSGTIELSQASAAFDRGVTRLVERFGAAEVPAWPKRN